MFLDCINHKTKQIKAEQKEQEKYLKMCAKERDKGFKHWKVAVTDNTLETPDCLYVFNVWAKDYWDAIKVAQYCIYYYKSMPFDVNESTIIRSVTEIMED